MVDQDETDMRIAAVLGLFLGLAYLFVSLRVYVKTFLSKSWGADDTLLLVSLVKLTILGSCYEVQASNAFLLGLLHHLRCMLIVRSSLWNRSPSC